MKISFGHIKGGKVASPIPMGASEVIKAQSGRFIVNDGSGRGEIAGASDDFLIGFIEEGDKTCSSTEGATIVNNIHDPSAVFQVPFIYDGSSYTTNYSTALLYTTADLYTTSNNQYVDLGTDTKHHVLIVDGLAATATAAAINDGYVHVMFYNDAFVA